MITTDRSAAVIAVNSHDTAAGIVVLTGQGTLTALCALFETRWAPAQPLEQAEVRDSQGLTSPQATTIRLLSEGSRTRR
ncbi:hypothetical protein [Streptomyces sp. NPDC023588]|uniref:hypothetical protein n=1 Tax=Streptomyces sp. NPDC023588 TaxID=3154907 RepID=UPI0033D33B1A